MTNRADSHTIHSGSVTRRILALAQQSGARILVVDDDELELALICDRLEHCGFDVRRAANGEEALNILDTEWFPVILTDWQMPVMSGIELTERLRAKGITDTVVLMLTVLDKSFDYERAYEAGVDEYLTKKLPEIELFARIHAAFNTLNLRRALKEAQAQVAALLAK
jgi:two-component system phosphate regulon response regulator PhoB